MPRGRKKKIKEPEIKKEPKIEVKTNVKVLNKSGDLVRTYDLEVHGKDFKKLADGFATKIGGKVE